MANNYYNFTTPFVSGTKVRSDQVNSEYSGVESAFDLLPTTPNSLITGKSWFGVDVQGATVNEYLITTEDAVSPLENGQRVAFFATHTNDGGVTFNVNSTGLVAAVDNDGGALVSDAIVNGQYYEFVYDATNTQWRRSLASSQSVPGGPANAVQIQSDPTGDFFGSTDFTFDGSELFLNASGVQILEARENEFILLSADTGSISAGDPIDLAFRMQSADNETYGFIGFDSDTTWTFKNDVWGAEILFAAVDATGSEGVLLTMKADESEVAFLSDFNTPVLIQGDTGSLGTDNGALIIENDATLYMAETGSAQIDVSGYGQLFVNDNFSPSRLFWRNDAGTEFDLTLVGGSTTPGGLDTEVQYNDGGAFGGMGSAMQFNDSNNRITMGATIAGSGTQLLIQPDITTGFYVNIIDNAETLTSGTMLSVGTESNSASGNIVTIDAISVNNTATALRVYQGANTDQTAIQIDGFTTGSPRVDFTQLGTERARLQYLDSTDEFTITSSEIAALGNFYVRNANGVMYAQDSNTAGGNAQATLGFRDSASANLGSIGFTNGDGNMRITVGNLSGGNIELRPQSGDVELYDAGSAVARTLPVASGGLEVNNTLTGGGFERVLTTSDLSGGTPGGADTQVQFNNAGSFGGDADFTWNGTRLLILGTGNSTVFQASVSSVASGTVAFFDGDPSTGQTVDIRSTGLGDALRVRGRSEFTSTLTMDNGAGITFDDGSGATSMSQDGTNEFRITGGAFSGDIRIRTSDPGSDLYFEHRDGSDLFTRESARFDAFSCIFQSSGNEIVRVDNNNVDINRPIDLSDASAGQIQFPATQNASANDNTLDDYQEEQQFTITMTPSGSGSINVDTSNDELAYVKIGRFVWLQGEVSVASVSGPTGEGVDIELPFTSLDAAGFHSQDQLYQSCRVINLNGLADGFYECFINRGANTMRIRDIDGSPNLADNFQATTIVAIDICYMANA